MILLIKCKVSPMRPVAQSNVSIMAAEDRVFGSPTLPQRKSVPPAIHPVREMLYLIGMLGFLSTTKIWQGHISQFVKTDTRQLN